MWKYLKFPKIVYIYLFLLPDILPNKMSKRSTWFGIAYMYACVHGRQFIIIDSYSANKQL